MRKNAPYNDRLERPPLAQAIMEAVENGVGWEHIGTLIEALSEKGLVDANSNWDKSGRSLLGALMSARRASHDGVVPVAVLDLVLRIDPQALVRKDAGGNTPVDFFLDKLENKNDDDYRLMETAQWWLTHACKEQLTSWVPENRYGERIRPEPNGYHMVNAVMKAEYYSSEVADGNLMATLADMGFDFNVRDRNNDTPGTWIKHQAQWEAFLKHGGDAFAMVDGDGEKGPRPLWRYMVERGQGTASEAAKAWALENAGDEMKKKAYNDYWNKLADRARSSVSPSDITRYLRAHPDFLTLRDARGRTPAMYGIRMHGSSFRALEQKRFAQMNKERDEDGHSLWAYAFSKGKTMGGEMVSFLLKSGAPRDPNPVTGRGWLASVIIDFDDKDRYDRWIRDAGAIRKLTAGTTFEQWWAMKPQDKAVVMDYVSKLLDDHNTAPAFNHVICQFAEHIDDQDLVEKALRYNISQYGGENLNINGIKLYFQRGMNPGKEDEDLENLRGKRGMLPADIAQIEALLLDMRSDHPDQAQRQTRGMRF